MSEETSLVTKEDVFSIVESAFGALEFTNISERIDWQEIREVIDPKGVAVKAEELVDRQFTILKMKPVHSSFDNATNHFYWIVGIDEDGERFNTALGGAAVVEELDAFLRLNYELHEAMQAGDDERRGQLLAMGAGRPITVTMRQKQGGQYGRYYVLD